MKRTIAIAALGLLAAGCGYSTTENTCGTTDIPPIAADPVNCANEVVGFQWYSASKSDVAEPDERPVIGQPLDGDWWDPQDKYDVADGIAVPKTPKTTSAPKPTPKKPTPTATRR